MSKSHVLTLLILLQFSVWAEWFHSFIFYQRAYQTNKRTKRLFSGKAKNQNLEAFAVTSSKDMDFYFYFISEKKVHLKRKMGP